MMSIKKHEQLLSNGTVVIAKLNFNNNQLTEFVTTCNKTCNEINTKLDSMQTALHNLGSDFSLLSKTQIETLHSLQHVFTEATDPLNKTLKKQASEFSKKLEKLEKDRDQLTSAITALSGASKADLDDIINLRDQSKPLFEQCKGKLNAALKEISRCETKMLGIDNTLHRLNLRDNIEHMTKQLEKDAKELGMLKAHLDSQKNGVNQYALVISPLRTALAALNQQTKRWEEPPVDAKATSEKKGPSLTA